MNTVIARSGPPGAAPRPVTAPPGGAAPDARRLPRLLSGVDQGGPVDLDRHLALWGPAPRIAGRHRRGLIDELERAGLRGHGGAWFPAAAKWRAVAARRATRPVVVINGAEGEPASRKDRLLVREVPHLVLDGAAAAAGAVGAARVVAHVPADLVGPLRRAVAERAAWGLDPVPVEVAAAADAYLAGEESAVAAFLNGGAPGTPTFKVLEPVYRRGVDRQPTLVQNAETLAHAALVARLGADWFRALGTEGSPGTALVTVSGMVGRPRVFEVPLGLRLGGLLRAAGATDLGGVAGVLLGGYGGSWLALPAAADVPLAEEHLRPLGATLGAGVVGVVGFDSCPLAETAHIARYMAGQSAGQCGPCVMGLPALAEVLAALAWDRRPPAGVLERTALLCDQVEGRGACRHPDGVARLVRSALAAFPDHARLHASRGPCTAAGAPPVLPKAREARRR